MNPTQLLNITNEFLAIREEERVLADRKKRIEKALVATYEEAGIEFIETEEGQRVTVENRPRRTIKGDVLAENLAADVLALVLRKVDTEAFDAAVESGLIDENIADKAVITSYSTQVRVYGARVQEERV
jgi:hypothetical protein